MKKRVVVTGLGMLTPVGLSLEESWKSFCEGKSGVGEITAFDASDFPCRVGAEVKGFDPLKYIGKKDLKKMDTFIQFAIAASDMAIEDSGLEVEKEDPLRIGVIVGAGLGGLPHIAKNHKAMLNKGHKRISPFFIPMVLINLAPGQISMRHGFQGPNYSVVSACASGNHSIGSAFRAIQYGDADVMITGGAESVMVPMAVGGFCQMKALSTSYNSEPHRASRPFDKNRDGFVMGEGAGILVLEELEHAKARNARIYAEMVGFGASGDAYHISMPDPDKVGITRCMQAAVDDASLNSSEVDYVNAHGTSTFFNDRFETEAIKMVFGDHAKKLLVSSTKSMTGHLFGGAGGVEAGVCVKAIETGIVPPTINYEEPDPECDLDYVPNQARDVKIKVAISNSFGFGGTNASTLFKKFEE